MSELLIMEMIAACVFLPPSAVFLWLSMAILVGRKPTEAVVVRNCKLAIATAFIAALMILILHPYGMETRVVFGSWFSEGSYHYDIAMQTDLLAISYGLFSTLLLYLICSFSQRYLHREPGFYRFYLVLLLFTIGLLLVSFSGSIELLLVGWELVGLSSIMLIAFFTQRPQPPQNGLWVFSIYRITDIGLYAAILYLHAFSASTLFGEQSSTAWAGIQPHVGAETTALLLIFAVMGKAALFPFCSWLPRAMEGPTPSSAVFYGALSVHLGPFLLLRMSDLIAGSVLLSTMLVLIGALTVLVGNLSGRVQSDIKGRLSFGAVSQLGFITMEIGLGWVELALVHVITHAVFRTLLFLRAPSLLHERHHLEQMLGHHISLFRPTVERSSRLQRFIYRFSLERGFLDVLLVDLLTKRFLAFVRRVDRLERGVADFIAKDKRLPPQSDSEDEVGRVLFSTSAEESSS